MSIVITGNPGVGKHTITGELAKRLRLPILDINKIAKDGNMFEKSKDGDEVDTVKLEGIIKENLLENNIIVGHLAPYVIKKNQLEIMIVLRRNPYDLISVYKKRNYTPKKSLENLGSEVLGIIAHDAIAKFQEKVFQINTSEKSVDEVIEKIMGIITHNTGSEIIDWLDLIVKNDDLKKFFAD
ncbi:MAG: adenylate kinase family protein [Nitrosopumilus sp.]|uniref:adenylate kinase family protein n=1 Tax=Nitrosopumilus sp. TaxID=2024843 RepID=UPI0029312F65|nr:AAA family ATPase [Nitrosopumilus sp.]